MPARRVPVHALLAALAVGLAGLPAAARADDVLGATTTSTEIRADGGVTAWRAPDPAGDRLVVRFGDAAPRTTALRLPAAPFDVGATGRAGEAQLVYASRCSTATRRCDLRRVLLDAGVRGGAQPVSRLLTRIPYHGGGAPALAVEGRRIAYADQGSRRDARGRTQRCDVPYTRTLRSARARRLDRGTCGSIDQLDLEGRHIAVLASPPPPYGTGATEARVVAVTGGPSRRLQREAQGEESNFLGAVSLDGGTLYTGRGGIRQANVFTAWRLRDGRRQTVRAFTSITGEIAHDDGRLTYEQTAAGAFDDSCDGPAGQHCSIVDAGDAFTLASRLLPPVLEVDVEPAPSFVGQPLRATGTLTRRRVTRTAQGAVVPIAGERVTLLQAQDTRLSDYRPTGLSGTTDAAGAYAVDLPADLPPRPSFAVLTAPAAGGIPVAGRDTATVPLYVRMGTPVARRLEDGRLEIRGTIDPPRPGRTVKLERREARVCDQPSFPGRPTPSTAETPAGCVDRFGQDPLATAAVAPDGASYVLTAPASVPAGRHRVALDFAGGADVNPGETAQFDAP